MYTTGILLLDSAQLSITCVSNLYGISGLGNELNQQAAGCTVLLRTLLGVDMYRSELCIDLVRSLVFSIYFSTSDTCLYAVALFISIPTTVSLHQRSVQFLSIHDYHDDNSLRGCIWIWWIGFFDRSHFDKYRGQDYT